MVTSCKGRKDIFFLTQTKQALTREKNKIHAYFTVPPLFLEENYSEWGFFLKMQYFLFLKLTYCPENSLISIIIGKTLDDEAVIVPGNVFDYNDADV